MRLAAIPDGAVKMKVENARFKPHIVYKYQELKNCANCLKWKELAEFGTRKRSYDGLQPYCKECNTRGRKRYELRID